MERLIPAGSCQAVLIPRNGCFFSALLDLLSAMRNKRPAREVITDVTATETMRKTTGRVNE